VGKRRQPHEYGRLSGRSCARQVDAAARDAAVKTSVSVFVGELTQVKPAKSLAANPRPTYNAVGEAGVRRLSGDPTQLGVATLLSEQEVARSWSQMFKGRTLEPASFERAEQLLEELRPESPLRHRLTVELEELRSIHSSSARVG
jgi:hypothetical protein